MVATRFGIFAGLRERSSANIETAPFASGVVRPAKLPVPSTARRKHDSRRILALRLAALFALIAIPFWNVFGAIVSSAGDGSRIAYLIVVPVLVAMIAVGHRAPPRGVGDAESDWILAAIFGGLGLFLRHLMSNRFPTLSGLWQLPLVGAVLWAACVAAVLFGVRRVMQMWSLWVFALATVTPLPYLLITAAAGGGVVAATAVAGIIGGLAVFLAGRAHPLPWRLCAGVASTSLSLGAALIAVGGGADRSTHSLLVLVLLCAGLFPVCGFLVLFGIPSRTTESAVRFALPRRSTLSLAVLAAGAAVVLILNLPYGTPDGTPARAQSNWATYLGWPATEKFSFITRYLGERAMFVRHAVPSIPGLPEAAVDVITADNLANLRTYRDALWYPATVPPNYRDLDLGNPEVIAGRAAATDSSLATDTHAPDWYVVTWLWNTGTVYQQVFVVVNQTWTSRAAPPVPAPLSIRATVIGPALWLVRQQADPATKVDPTVVARAQQVVRRVLDAGRSRHG